MLRSGSVPRCSRPKRVRRLIDTVHRLSGRSIASAYMESALLIFSSAAAASLYLTTSELWPGRWALLAVLPLLIITLAEPPWRYAFTRLDVADDHLRVSTGIIVPSERTMRWSDMASFEVRQSWANRLVGTYVLTIAQSGDERNRMRLHGVSARTRDVVAALFEERGGAAVRPAGGGAVTPAPDEEWAVPSELVHRSSPAELVLAGLSFGQFAVLGGAATLTVVDLIETFGLIGGLQAGIAAAPLPMAVAIVAAVLAAGLALTVIRFAGFEVRRARDGALEISYGLIARNHRRIDPRSVVGIVVQRNIVETLLGRVRLWLLTTDSSSQLGGNLLLPALPRRIVRDVVRRSFPLEAAAIGLDDPSRWALLRQVSILVVTMIIPLGVWIAGTRVAWALWVVALAVAATSVLAWYGGKLLCSRLRSVDSGSRIVHSVRHISESRRVLLADAAHAVSTVSFLGVPVTAAVVYLAGHPRAARAVRFDPGEIDALAAGIAAGSGGAGVQDDAMALY